MKRAMTAAGLASVGATVWMLLAPAIAVEQHLGVFAMGLLLCVEGLPFVAMIQARRSFPPWAGGALGAAAAASLLTGQALPLAFAVMGLGTELRRRSAVDAPLLDVVETVAALVATLGVIAALALKLPLSTVSIVAAVVLLLSAGLSAGEPARPVVAAMPLRDAIRTPGLRHLVLTNMAMNALFHLRMAATIYAVLTVGPGLAALSWSYAAALVAIAIVSVLPLVKGRAAWAAGPLLEGLATAGLAILVARAELNLFALVVIEALRHTGMAWYGRQQTAWRALSGIPTGTTSPFLAAAWGISPFAGFVGISLAAGLGTAAPLAFSAAGFVALSGFLFAVPPPSWTWKP